MNVTLRGGFVVDVGRGDDGEGRKGVLSVAVAEDAMAAMSRGVQRANG